MGTVVIARTILQGGESPFTAQTGHAEGGGHSRGGLKRAAPGEQGGQAEGAAAGTPW